VPAKVLALRHLEPRVGGDAGRQGGGAGAADRRLVIVEADEAAVGEGLRHQDGRGAVAAADVRHLGAARELLGHAVQSRQPILHQEGRVAAAEEALDAAEQALVVLVPCHALAAAEGVGDLRLVQIGGCDHVERTGDVDRARFVGERHRLFGRHREPPAVRIVVDVAGSRLGGQPFAHITLCGLRALGELRGRRRTVHGQRLIESELVADQHEGAADRGGHVAHHLAHEGLQLVGVDGGGLRGCHVVLRYRCVDRGGAGYVSRVTELPIGNQGTLKRAL
jgi:hypothetical protein